VEYGHWSLDISHSVCVGSFDLAHGLGCKLSWIQFEADSEKN
jgi:hypothetical protein